MQKIILAIISLVVLGIGLYYFYTYQQSEKGELDLFSTWKKFTPKSHLFTAILPNSPQYAKDFIAIPNTDKKRRYDMYASEKVDGTLFLISMITYPREIDTSFAEKILRQNIDEVMQKKLDNRELSVSKEMFQGRKAIDFSAEGEQFDIEGKAILDDHTVYLLTYTTHKNNYDPKEYQYFVDSFHILNPVQEDVKK